MGTDILTYKGLTFNVVHPNPGTLLSYKIIRLDSSELPGGTSNKDSNLVINEIGVFFLRFYDSGETLVDETKIVIELVAPEDGVQPAEYPTEMAIFSDTLILPYEETAIELLNLDPPEDYFSFETGTPAGKTTITFLNDSTDDKPLEYVFLLGDLGKEVYLLQFDKKHKTLFYRIKSTVQNAWLKNYTRATITLSDVEVAKGMLEALRILNSMGTAFPLAQYMRNFVATYEEIAVWRILRYFLIQKAQVKYVYGDNSVNVELDLSALQELVDKMEDKFTPEALTNMKASAASGKLTLRTGGRRSFY